MNDEIIYKELDETLVIYKRIHGKAKDLPPIFESLKEKAGSKATGVPIVIHHWPLRDDNGYDMDVCIPIDSEIKSSEFDTMILKGGHVASLMHKGAYEKIGETYSKMVTDFYSHGLPIAESGRMEYPNLDLEDPTKNVIEVQLVLHDWENKFSQNLRRVLGSDVEKQVMAGFNELILTASHEERTKAIITALETLETVADDSQRYEILSRCAHVYPPELIPPMRELWLSTKNIDAVIDKMKELGGYYPKCTRNGRVISQVKNPANPKAFEEAKTREEKRKAYCFCPLIKESLDKVPSTFCNCSAGWPRQIWEGILGERVRVDIVKSLLNDDDYCEFDIHLPDSILIDG
ncbi:MAG: GyrI-like domain-containing protein [Candidatus Thorarchaeota archaeon]